MPARLRKIFDPRIAEPRRVGAGVGLVVATLAAGTVLVDIPLVRAVFVAGATFVSVGYVVNAMLAGQRAVLQETRDLWGLAHVAYDGRPWPPPGGWALGADALTMLIREMRARESRTVVELGPGTSSVILAAADTQELRMVGLEHDERFVGTVAQQLAMHGVEYELIHAPLRAHTLDGKSVMWYDKTVLDRIPASIDVLIVDGPPNWNGAGNRAPAWPLLRSRLAPGAIIVVDDTQRPDERAMVAHWLTDGALSVIQDNGTFIALEVVA